MPLLHNSITSITCKKAFIEWVKAERNGSNCAISKYHHWKLLLWAYNFITKRIARSESIVWNKISIDLKLVKLIFCLYFPKDIFKMLRNISFTSFRSIGILFQTTFSRTFSKCYEISVLQVLDLLVFYFKQCFCFWLFFLL